MQDEMQEDDWRTSDHVHFNDGHKPVLTLKVQERPGSRFKRDAKPGEVSDAAMWRQLIAEMKRQNYFPGVWFVSDHGNAHLMRREPRKRRATGHDNKAASLIRGAERKYGDHGPLISGGLRPHWPERVKDQIRKALYGPPPKRRRR